MRFISYFATAKAFFSRLVDEDQPAISFQLLDLNNFGLTDDLYIKMNARGKPLTAFETFKARYEQKLGELFPDEIRTIGTLEYSVSDYFAHRMDTSWADFFWERRDPESNLYDQAVMNLFRAVALISRDPESESFIHDIAELRKRANKSSFSFFRNNGFLDHRFAEILFILLEMWCEGESGISKQLPNKKYFDEKKLFEKIVGEPTDLEFLEIVQFAGYVAFLYAHRDQFEPEVFQEWMRIIFNLSVNTKYDRPPEMQRSIAAIQQMVSNSSNILEYFADNDNPTVGFLSTASS